MDDALQSGLSQLRTLFPSPIPLELSDLVSLFGADFAPRLRAAQEPLWRPAGASPPRIALPLKAPSY